MTNVRAALTVLAIVLVNWLAPVAAARAAVIYSYQARSPTPASSHRSSSARSIAQPASRARSDAEPRSGGSAGAHAPNGPPLSTAVPGAQGENVAGVPSAEGDQLVENGLASPLCKSSMSGDLSSAAQRNCQTSGFVGAPAPTNNYAFDVNINVGVLGLSSGGLLSVIQDVFIAPAWNGIEWVVHALVVMLEWCYTLELLGGSTMSGVARGLREAEASFTEPWLTLVLAAASILAFYNGLVRRRVAETLGQALMTLAMMAAGLWIIADPLGTVGAIGQWANQASLGTLGAVAEGTPANAPRTLADSMRALFGGAIELPWCYLEFGNVRWCSDPALLDQRLHKAALGIVASQQGKLSCRPSFDHPLCTPSADAATLTIEHSAELVRAADTNGKLFLAFPANKPERNSVKESSSLLHVLCQATDDTKCTGPTAPQAEFRSDGGTFPRMLGVVLIAAGVLGMVMIFGLVAVHLLIAVVVSLFMLLLAPFAVLAPALGDGGRAVFGGWLTRLLGAVTSKLLFSFLLGALLSMQRILMSLPLGWWTQWLLISACWWAVFLKRHQAMAFLRNRDRQPVSHERRPITRRIGGALESYGAIRHPVRWVQARINSRIAPAPPPADEQLRKRGHGSQNGKGTPTDGQAQSTLAQQKGPGRETAREKARTTVLRRGRAGRDEAVHGNAGARTQADPRLQAALSAKQAQLTRVRGARTAALAVDDRRRAAKLAVRERRIEAELARERHSQGNERSTVDGGENARRDPESSRAARQRDSRAGQADGGNEPTSGPKWRAGIERSDSDAAARRRAGSAAKEAAGASFAEVAYAERLKHGRELDPARDHPETTGGLPQTRSAHSPDSHVSGSRDPRTSGGGSSAGAGAGRRPGSGAGPVTGVRSGTGASVDVGDLNRAPGEPKSRVMDDARLVVERRKRQLGYGSSQ